MTELDRLKISYARLHGEFVGTLEGILFWDIPEELKERLTETIDQKTKQYEEVIKPG